MVVEKPNTEEKVPADVKPNIEESAPADVKPNTEESGPSDEKPHTEESVAPEESAPAGDSVSAEENVAEDEAAEAANEDTNEDAPEFAEGQIVELHGLSVESLNGCIGRVHSQKGERFVIVLPPPEKDGEEINLDPWQYKSIRPKNIRKLEDQEKERKAFQAKENSWNSAWTRKQTEEAYRRSVENKMWQSQKWGWLSTAKRWLPLVAIGILGILIPKYNLLANVPFLNRFAKPTTPPEPAQETAATLDDDDFDEQFFQDDEALADEEDMEEVS